MEKLRTTFLIVAVYAAAAFVLGSCGPREKPPQQEQRTPVPESSKSEPSPNPAPVRDPRPVVVAFGDSLTAGVAGRSYPDDLQDLFDQHGLAYRVENQGVSGDTTTDGLARIDNVMAEHPALVLLEFGGNDGLRGIPVEATRKNLEQMIQQLQGAHLRIVLLGITLPPNYGSDYVKPFTAMFPELARQYHLPLMPFLLLHVYQSQALMQPDGIHPNGDGNRIVASDVFGLIQPLLQGRKAGTP